MENYKGTKGDYYHKKIINRILSEGSIDENPRPKYSDGTPAHTLSVNHEFCTYDLAKGEFPIITLRPIAIKSAIGELLWIYQDQSNDLDLLKEKYGVTWWDSWDIGDRTIGSCYGETVRKHHLMNGLLLGLEQDPDGRRHIINMWQVDDFKESHGLKPCCYETNWNVRRDKKSGTTYLDMLLKIRSNDFCTAGCINQLQYLVFLYLVARHFDYVPGRFSVMIANVQIYDRHIENAKELLRREPIDCTPRIVLNPDKHDFYDFTVDDIKIIDYPTKLIKETNPQLKFDLGI